jgi:hypothetical protein
MLISNDVRQWAYYPIIMPLTSEGNGPASVENGEVRELSWEVWSRDLSESFGPFDNLCDAINESIRL